MKKIISITLALLFITSMAFAGTITITPLSSDSGMVYTYFNTAYNTIKNCINGNIESANIKDGTIAEIDMASAINPRVRDAEYFNNFIYTGMLPVTSATLTTDTSAGTSYVSGYRVVTSATAHTYTTTLDTWVYIDINGTFQYVETAIGGAQPTTPANSLLLAKVNTAGGIVAAVTDLRTTSISLASAEDFYIKGMQLWWGGATKISVDTGVVYNGTTRIVKTTATALNVTTAGHYVTGASEQAVSKWLYIYAKADGSLLLDDNAPNYHDTSGTTQGKKYYYKYGTAYYRRIGAIYLDAVGSGQVTNALWDDGDGKVQVMWDVPVTATTTLSLGAWSTATAVRIPATSTTAILGLEAADDADFCGTWVRPNGSNWAINQSNGVVSGSSANSNSAGGQRICMTDPSQQIQYYNSAGDGSTRIDVEGYIENR